MHALRRTVLIGAMLAATVGGVVATASPALAADGKVYAYQYRYWQGFYCGWVGNDTDWSTCYDNAGDLHNMLNQASSLWNNGYAGGYDKVNFYWGKSYYGAWACLGVGDYWADLPLGREHFTWGPGLPGYGQVVNDNVASHKWVTRCGNP
jgi:hypothetical protein